MQAMGRISAMKSSPAAPRSHCPITFSLEVFGDRWTLVVLRDLIIAGKRRFAELQASPEGIASNVLADRLRELAAQDIVVRERDPQDGRQVLYRPTAKGLALLPILVEMIRWGATYDPQTAAPAAFVDRIARDRAGVIDEIRRRHEPLRGRRGR